MEKNYDRLWYTNRLREEKLEFIFVKIHLKFGHLLLPIRTELMGKHIHTHTHTHTHIYMYIYIYIYIYILTDVSFPPKSTYRRT